jgi:hypothetical protein
MYIRFFIRGYFHEEVVKNNTIDHRHSERRLDGYSYVNFHFLRTPVGIALNIVCHCLENYSMFRSKTNRCSVEPRVELHRKCFTIQIPQILYNTFSGIG